MDQTLSVALYARVSSQRQVEGMTINSQIAALRHRIEQDGFSPQDELCFRDEGYSGSTLLRPALEKLRDLAYSGGIDRLYVHSPDRLARKYLYQMLLLDELTRQSVDVIFLNQDPQHQSAEGDLLLQMQGMIAEYERAKIMERTRRGRRFAARQGKISVLAHAPYGYRYIPKHLGEGEARYEIVPEQARLVQEMFTWVGVEGLSLGDVVQRLAERQIPTATGKLLWDRATIRGLLHQPAYTGLAKYGKTRMIPRTSGRRPKRGDPVTPRQEKVACATTPEEQESIQVPALVSDDLFRAVAERMEENRLRQREQKQGAEFLLSGLLVCHQCGSAYCGRRPRRHGGGHRYVYYHCLGTDKYRHGGETICKNKSVNGTSLETSVWRDVCELLQDPGRLQRELQRRLERAPNEQAGFAQRQESISKLKRRMARLLDAYENDWLDKIEFESRMSRVKELLARAQEVSAQRERELQDTADLRSIVNQFEAFAEQIASGLENADLVTQRKLLRLLIKRIDVDEH
ncbi:MAG: recombinase family protein, partial [Gammaproteobacteria bacterium]|nr:recombinase family protein [Gammaproteobacteria bacterium]